jgi:serine protease Do
VSSTEYRPGDWNELTVRIEEARLMCYVNGKLTIESSPTKLKPGKLGLVKFRNTVAEFKRFRIGPPRPAELADDQYQSWIAELTRDGARATLADDELKKAASASDYLRQRIVARADELKREADRLSRLADDVAMAPALLQLSQLQDESSRESLFLGALWIAVLDNPELDVSVYQRKVERMAQQILEPLPKDAAPPARIAALDRYLFQENGYHGSRSEYYHPANSHLDRVIDEREGLPITLCILYSELARRIDVPIHGIGLPGHFVVGYQPKDGELELIDVFEAGKRLSRLEARLMVSQYANRLPVEEDFRPQKTKEVLVRVLRNLIGTAQSNRNHEALLRYSSALVALVPTEAQFRMMRCAARFYTHRYAAAKEDIEVLLSDPQLQVPTEELQRLADAISEQLAK